MILLRLPGGMLFVRTRRASLDMICYHQIDTPSRQTDMRRILRKCRRDAPAAMLFKLHLLVTCC